MRNPGLRLVGIRSSQGGRGGGGGGGSFVTNGDIGEIGVFGNNRAEEELRLWLESRLDALGIDPVAYSRFVLSLLRHPDSALSPINPHETTATIGRRNRARARSKIPNQGDREQRRAVVQCLTNAADQKCGVESLVDELCTKLRDLEGGGPSEGQNDGTQKFNEGRSQVDQQSQEQQLKNNFESLTPRDRALRYYAAFPALQPATPKKNSNHKKEKNLGTNSCSFNSNNHNINININNNNNNNKNRNTTGVNGNNKNKNNNKTHTNGGNITNNKGRHKKSRMSNQAIGPLSKDGKESSFPSGKSMERDLEKKRELELDELRLAQLQAKFDESLEALWDNGPGNSQDKASIWAAPSLSIPSGPLWPIDTCELPLILPLNDSSVSSATTPYQESVVDDSPIIPWDIDFTVGKMIDEPVNWSEQVGEGPWSWKTLDHSPNSAFYAVPKTPAVKEDSDDEDLLTSAKTHFCPIKEDGNWADGTTFPINNSFERVAYRRSDCGNLFYLPGSESPYMEYREEPAIVTPIAQPAFIPKFRVKQCDKSVQTDPIRSPIKRRIASEEDRRHYAEIEAEDIINREVEDDEAEKKDTFGNDQLGLMQPGVSLLNDRKRRHSSSFKCRSLAALRPLTL